MKPKPLWSRAEWACKTDVAKDKLRIWRVIGCRSNSPDLRNIEVRSKATGRLIGPVAKWIDADKLATFQDTGH